jgi:hypothetical protein
MSDTAVSSTSLLEETRRLFRESKKSPLVVFQETGINFYWLKKFKAGEVSEPSVNTVQKLYEYLTGKSLIG